MQTVAIAGVGLIGGSFGLALKKAGFAGKILGVSSPATLRIALDRGAIDEAADLAQAAHRADLIYLSQPIGRILDTLHHLDAMVNPEALVTDAGSTKGAIVSTARKHIRRCVFLGGHPMAGKEKRGVAEADGELFRGRTYVLTPEDPAMLDKPPARSFLEWLERIGAAPVVLTAEEHDRIVAFTSHLPQLVSTALAATVAEQAGDRLAVAGPGLADTTRLALSPYELWRDILATNSQRIEEALTAYITKLEHLRDNLRTRQIESEFEIAAALATTLRK
ncbi:MAG TPA: prephenate dehydrogenase/arogenate dehydrogenase family protein [Bryobacteraceae bacterium]|nr:prephenate dehydrogenase/arogenate dehydrogenase family protein [Bryobacteraceae bacterium]